MNEFETRFSVSPEFIGTVYRAWLWRSQGGYSVASAGVAGLAIWRLVVSQEIAFWAQTDG